MWFVGGLWAVCGGIALWDTYFEMSSEIPVYIHVHYNLKLNIAIYMYMYMAVKQKFTCIN